MLIDNLTIIGVGLIGGSLARALKQANRVRRVTGCDHNKDALEQALDLQAIDDYATDIAMAVQGADVVVISTPLSTTAELMSEIATAIESKTVLTDVGSAKGSVVRLARELLGKHLPNFVPGHPIAGTEKSGVSASFAGLFVNHNVILTPLPETDAKAHKLVTAMWQAVGAEVVNLDKACHDQVLAATSHLPHMLAYALVDCLTDMQDYEEVFQYTAGGFVDFTRIASSNPEMWHDICFANRSALLDALTVFAGHMDSIRQAIEHEDSGTLLRIFKRAKQVRDNCVNRKSI